MLRRDLRGLGQQGDDLADHRQGGRGDDRLGQPPPRRRLRRRVHRRDRGESA